MKIVPSFEVNEKTSPGFRYLIKNPEEDPSFVINSVKVYIYISGTADPPVYVNGRDGGDTTGLTYEENLDGTWTVIFKLDPEDNVIVNRALYAKSGYERHTVILEINYATNDIHYEEIELFVKDLPIVA